MRRHHFIGLSALAPLCFAVSCGSVLAFGPAPQLRPPSGIFASDAPFGNGPDALIWRVQKCGSDCGGPSPGTTPSSHGGNPGGGLTYLSTGNTHDIVTSIGNANTTCGARDYHLYRIDCLRIYYLKVADELPDSGDYLPIKQALRAAARDLDAIVRSNLDPSAPLVALHDRNKPLAGRIAPARAVSAASERRANAAALKIIERTSLLILRSGDDPKRRSAHYQEISAAVDNNMLLLRSA